ncbi:AraC family transcriptional regulator [Vallitalea pronyensis]|uniref:AraC family transcriptional regulator n=1 Tax=Vallitalea pronyensis TaxID=1348613 RepID=A0A8J8MK72_9FIRM|nr:AraC family transcriptional regulator [Vallitalea pronyensis]QUI22763.1 AraC family transcriptional regulator [Vallitalea pronyensis]
MNNRDIVLSSITLIEKNLKNTISLAEISRQCGFSYYYFSKLFKTVTGYSPKSYILARKISESVDDLLNTNQRVLDIGLKYGFGSPETYTRAFKRIMHKNPNEIRKDGKVNSRLLLKPITKQTLNRFNHALDKSPEFVELNERQLMGIPFYYNISMKSDLSNSWSLFMQNLSTIPYIKKRERFYQMQYWFPDQDDDSTFFFIAVEVERIESVPIQFVAKTIPAGTYMKFRHKGRSNQVGYTYQYIYEEWLPNTDYRLSEHFNFEHYGEEYFGPYNEESVSDIYIPFQIK